VITPVPQPGLVISGRTLDLLLEAIHDAQKWRLRNGGPRPAYSHLASILASGTPAVDGHTDVLPQTVGQAVAMEISEAAELLGLSERHVRRMARELGGRKVGRSWLLDRAAVLEHREGSL
jgi:excisionase family DNA binding protein